MLKNKNDNIIKICLSSTKELDVQSNDYLRTMEEEEEEEEKNKMPSP